MAGLHQMMARHVDDGVVPGLVFAVVRGDEEQAEALGCRSMGGDPMTRDTIFRIASLSKPIGAAAAMVLVEDGVLQLEQPVEDWLPELADRRVLTSLDAPVDDTVPARRSITVHDLLTLRMGMGVVLAPPGTYPIQDAIASHEALSGPPWPRLTPDPDEWIGALGELPLVHQPGEGWMYDTAMDVLGVLLARASGKPLGALLRERIFEPLEMHDTGFSVPAGELGRLAGFYRSDPDTGGLALHDEGGSASLWSQPPRFESVAGGLVSTIDDYLRFTSAMMLGATRPEPRRILSADSIALMTQNHITADQRRAGGPILGEDRGWGFGMAVDVQHGCLGARPGRFGWDGGSGTAWRSDPRLGLTAILLTQRMMDGPEPPPTHVDFWDGLERTAA